MIAPGTVISHYSILEKLGEGGMGVVYKAEDLTLKRTVALKFLPPHVSASQTDRARFLLEAQAAAALNHPNICTIYGIEESDAHSFIAMEFVDGQTLREKRGTINLPKAIDIGIQIADGLAIAHERGIVHRDIKPENIMVRKDGIVQIMDFGLAKLRASRASRLTKEGSTVGTAGYMAPEQVQGQDTDHRSDIFSLGVVLYELFTGELPFKGVHETALLYEIVNVDPAPMSSVKPEIDPELDRIVLECLQKEPDERYQGVKDISKDLKRFKRESSKQRMSRTIPARQFPQSTAAGAAQAAPGPVRASSRIWPAAAALLAVAVILLAWRAWRADEAPEIPSMRIPIQLPLGTPLLTGATTLAISPDGSRLVYLANASGTPKLFLRSFEQFDPLPVAGTEGAGDPFFSPDGQWIGYFANGKVMKVSIHGGAPIQVCTFEGFPRGGCWTSDDQIWYGMINQAIFRVPASGGEAVAVTRLDSANREISHRFPSVLPDNKTVIFTVKHNNITSFDDAVIAAENIETHARTTVIRGGTFARYIPAGYLLYARGDAINAVAMDAGTLALAGTPRAVIQGGMLNPFSGISNFDVSENGTLIYIPMGPTPDRTQRLAWLLPDGSTQPLLDTLRSYGFGRISPDGQRIATTVRAANDDIWVYHIERKTLTRLTFGGGNSDLPIWTRDGKDVLYAREVGTDFAYFLKAWDGGGSERRLGKGVTADATSPASFSPDGRHLAFPSKGDIYILSLAGEENAEPLVRTPATESWPSFSPDGRYLSYCSDESGRYEVYVVPFPSGEGKWQISTNGGFASSWSADGKLLQFGAGKSIMRTDVTLAPRFDFGSSRKVLDLPATWNNQTFSVFPDGSKWMLALEKFEGADATQVNIIVGWIPELRQKLSP